MNPKHPVYIVSKGRWDTRKTSRALDAMRVPYRIIVEKHEFDRYAAEVGPEKLLVLPQRYLDEYDTFDDPTLPKSKGPGAARNFAWDHSISEGATYHWVMDDNFDYFFRLNRNTKIPVGSGTILRAAEDFVERYENLAVSGFQYDKFCICTENYPPYVLNTRIYSCLLIRNDIPYRWRGRYNEDTDLSLRVLKDGWCTLQFNAFLCGKLTTQVVKGGNTEEFYAREGTLPKSQMLVDMHPDVARLVWKFSRWHHDVDYRRFRMNVLRRKPGLVIPKGVNNYGMVPVFAPGAAKIADDDYGDEEDDLEVAPDSSKAKKPKAPKPRAKKMAS